MPRAVWAISPPRFCPLETELTRGELVNTNATWLGEQLTLLGFSITEVSVVDDHLPRIVQAVCRLASAHRVVLATGGLGPTTDDLTAEAAARALEVPLELHEPSLDQIRQRFVSFGREMSSSNVKQAHLPRGCIPLPNAVGTAPGFAVRLLGSEVFFLPGVPREMQRLYFDHVQPRVGMLAERTMFQIRLRTFGLPESQVGERLQDIEASQPAVTLGYRASFPEIEVKILARAGSQSAAEAIAQRVAEQVKARLGDAVYGEGDDSFPAYIGRLLRRHRRRLAIAESCTGGRIGAMLTSVPGSSDYLLLDAVTYSNASKSRVLGVGEELLRAHGAVSAECAAAMAEGALRVADADLAVAVTGIAGPSGGSENKPVGNCVVRCGPARPFSDHDPAQAAG